MGYTKGTNTWLSDAGARVQDLSKLLTRLDKLQEAPFYSMLPKTVIKSEFYEWKGHTYKSKKIRLGELGTAGTTGVPTMDPTYVVVGSIIRRFGLTPGKFNMGMVTAVSGSNLTVTWDYGDAASHSFGAGDLSLPTSLTNATYLSLGNPAYALIIGNAQEFGADAPSAYNTTIASYNNYLQYMSKKLQLEDSYAKGSIESIGQDWKSQLADTMKIIKRDADLALWYGVMTTGASGTAPTTRGFQDFLSTYRSNHGGTLSYTQFNTIIRSMVETGGADPSKCTVFASGIVLQAINNWGYSQITITDDRNYVGMEFTKVKTNMGQLPLVWEPQLISGDFAIVDMSKVECVHPTGELLYLEPLAKTGDAKNVMVNTKFGLRLRDESCHGYFAGVTG